MTKFVVFARASRDVLARVVIVFHRLAVTIESLTAESFGARGMVSIEITTTVAPEFAPRIEARLYRLDHVLLVGHRDERQTASADDEPELSLMKVIYVITTGGTIEKAYSEPTGSVSNLGGKIDRYLHMLRLPGVEIRVVPLLNKDSLEMTDSDRRLILGTVRGLVPEGAPILITHGTDTMVETGRFLDHALGAVAVPIVLTGAMVPLGFDGSDALQNLTESLFAARTLDAGIYVVIHGEAFPIYRVRKDRALGRFVWTDENLM